MIGFIEETSKEEKLKYEYFLENIKKAEEKPEDKKDEQNSTPHDLNT